VVCFLCFFFDFLGILSLLRSVARSGDRSGTPEFGDRRRSGPNGSSDRVLGIECAETQVPGTFWNVVRGLSSNPRVWRSRGSYIVQRVTNVAEVPKRGPSTDSSSAMLAGRLSVLKVVSQNGKGKRRFSSVAFRATLRTALCVIQVLLGS